jgi:hypothetical protein
MIVMDTGGILHIEAKASPTMKVIARFQTATGTLYHTPTPIQDYIKTYFLWRIATIDDLEILQVNDSSFMMQGFTIPTWAPTTQHERHLSIRLQDLFTVNENRLNLFVPKSPPPAFTTHGFIIKHTTVDEVDKQIAMYDTPNNQTNWSELADISYIVKNTPGAKISLVMKGGDLGISVSHGSDGDHFEGINCLEEARKWLKNRK